MICNSREVIAEINVAHIDDDLRRCSRGRYKKDPEYRKLVNKFWGRG